MSRVRIIPGEGGRGMGTRVLLSDGTEIKGITRLTLEAVPNDFWRCTLDVLALPEEVEAVLTEVKVVRQEGEDGP